MNIDFMKEIKSIAREIEECDISEGAMILYKGNVYTYVSSIGYDGDIVIQSLGDSEGIGFLPRSSWSNGTGYNI